MPNHTDQMSEEEAAAFEAEARAVLGQGRTAERTGEGETRDETKLVDAIDGIMTLQQLVFALGRLEKRFKVVRRHESRGKGSSQTIRQAEDIVRALGRALASEDREGMARLHAPAVNVLGPYEAPNDDSADD